MGGLVGFQISFSQVPDAFKASLTRPVSAEEVKAAMFSIKGDKAPCSDGLNAGFTGDCIQLKERIVKRLQSWLNRLLSYGGRSQLLYEVLGGMQVYWCSIFILPKRILGEVESLLKGFLWTRAAMRKSGDKIQWDLGSSLQAKVSSIICNGEWSWPRQRNRAIMSIMADTLPYFKPNAENTDKVVWVPAANGKFSVKAAWKMIRNPNPKVP
ncbi:hypothetical protein Acr_12g0000880 [Actinidia rufa]|uniref:Uncharacterized protein n=1 Tax=Actinidia rufa TaxID=165716 RepID=A0A7J0FI26_9ERIC|nr:hypothetical protein Acr_12g0000880 [Actinidia rufa]